jgi:hypothetical protein
MSLEAAVQAFWEAFEYIKWPLGDNLDNIHFYIYEDFYSHFYENPKLKFSRLVDIKTESPVGTYTHLVFEMDKTRNGQKQQFGFTLTHPDPEKKKFKPRKILLHNFYVPYVPQKHAIFHPTCPRTSMMNVDIKRCSYKITYKSNMPPPVRKTLDHMIDLLGMQRPESVTKSYSFYYDSNENSEVNDLDGVDWSNQSAAIDALAKGKRVVADPETRKKVDAAVRSSLHFLLYFHGRMLREKFVVPHHVVLVLQTFPGCVGWTSAWGVRERCKPAPINAKKFLENLLSYDIRKHRKKSYSVTYVGGDVVYDMSLSCRPGPTKPGPNHKCGVYRIDSVDCGVPGGCIDLCRSTISRAANGSLSDDLGIVRMHSPFSPENVEYEVGAVKAKRLGIKLSDLINMIVEKVRPRASKPVLLVTSTCRVFSPNDLDEFSSAMQSDVDALGRLGKKIPFPRGIAPYNYSSPNTNKMSLSTEMRLQTQLNPHRRIQRAKWDPTYKVKRNPKDGSILYA